MHCWKKTFFLFSVLCVAFIAAACTGIEGGKDECARADEYTILIPANATKTERYAAGLLAEKFGKMRKSGVNIKTEDSGENGPVISVGETALAKKNGFTDELPPQSIEIRVKDRNIFIRGGTPGPLNGVVCFLEDDLGYRVYAEAVKNIPGGDDPGEVRIPDWHGRVLHVVDRQYTPPFEAREILYDYDFPHPGNPETALFFRMAPLSYHSTLPEESGAVENSRFFIHTYSSLVPAKKYYDDHPEYFALQGGQRVKQTSTFGSICYTNPDVITVMADRIREELKKNPGIRYISVSVNDGVSIQCECETCKKEIEKHGLPGVQMIVANKVAERLAEDYPDIRITTLVYGNGVVDPGDVTAHPCVVMFLAPIGARFNIVKMLVPLNENEIIVKSLTKCFQTGKRLYFWDYLEDGGTMPYPTMDPFLESIRYLARAGCSGYFADCTANGRSLMHLKKYVYSQLLWNPELDMESMISEFTAVYFGCAAPEMREYISLIRRAWQRFHQELKEKEDGVLLTYTGEESAAMTALFEGALKKAQGNNILTGRIAREYIPLLAMSLSGNPVSAGLEKYGNDLKRARELAVYMPPGSCMKKEKWIEKWEKKLAWSARTPDPDEYSPNTVTIWKPLTVDGYSDWLDDPGAVKGKAARHKGGKPWGIQWKYHTFLDYLIPGKEYVLRIHFRVEQKTPRKGTAFVMKAHHHGNETLNRSQPPLSAEFDGTADDSGTYKTAVLGKIIVKNPLSAGMFWMDSTVDPDEAVWYERMEFIPVEEYKEKGPIPKKTIIL